MNTRFATRVFFIFAIVFFTTKKAECQNMYACFENDKQSSLQLSVYFDENNKAKFVKYRGQQETFSLFFKKGVITKNPEGIPRTYWADIYIEKYRGVTTGTYTFTNAGYRKLDVTFKRKKDGKKFYF